MATPNWQQKGAQEPSLAAVVSVYGKWGKQCGIRFPTGNIKKEAFAASNILASVLDYSQPTLHH